MRKIILLIPLIILSCEVADYPFFIKKPSLSKTKPVFIIYIDSSSSNSAYIAPVTQLAQDSRTYLLENLYDNDEKAMEERFAIVDYPDGESWVNALIAIPSELAPDIDEKQDEHPNMVILFYGKGSGPDPETAQNYNQKRLP